MSIGTAAALAGLFITVVLGFAGTMRAIGRIELKLDLMWEWYLKQHTDVKPGGRRQSDPPAPD